MNVNDKTYWLEVIPHNTSPTDPNFITWFRLEANKMLDSVLFPLEFQNVETVHNKYWILVGKRWSTRRMQDHSFQEQWYYFQSIFGLAKFDWFEGSNYHNFGRYGTDGASVKSREVCSVVEPKSNFQVFFFVLVDFYHLLVFSVSFFITMRAQFLSLRMNVEKQNTR